MQIGAIESTWKRRCMIVASFPFVLAQDLWRQTKWTFGMAKGCWAKRGPIYMETTDIFEDDI